ncbi:MAG: hypothetical protein ACO1QB_15700 [Verrucomicrobiales bacterium]
MKKGAKVALLVFLVSLILFRLFRRQEPEPNLEINLIGYRLIGTNLFAEVCLRNRGSEVVLHGEKLDDPLYQGAVYEDGKAGDTFSPVNDHYSHSGSSLLAQE